VPQQTTAGNHSPPIQTPPQPDAYRRDAAEAADLPAVVPATGLTTADAEQRTAAWGTNELAGPAAVRSVATVSTARRARPCSPRTASAGIRRSGG
jgi:hypothetical protein